ncbi:MAG: hypothetical protein QXU98_07095 [Candidatus Parvarchaeota archaeon]
MRYQGQYYQGSDLKSGYAAHKKKLEWGIVQRISYRIGGVLIPVGVWSDLF